MLSIRMELVKWGDETVSVRHLGDKALVPVKDAIKMIGSHSMFYDYYYPRINLYLSDGRIKKNRGATKRTFINLNEIFK